MPPITYMQLLKKQEQKQGMYDPKNKETLKQFDKAMARTIRNLNKEGKGRVNTRKLTEFQYRLFDVMRLDPSTMEEHTEKERQEHLWHPERPLRPLQRANRNKIENAVCELTELGDFLGKEVPKEFTNAYDYILQFADPEDSLVIRKGLKLVDDTLELGIPLEKLEAGETCASTDEEKRERSAYKDAVKEGQANREANLKEFEEQQRLAEQKRQQASREADKREADEIAEKSRKQREEEKKRQEEEKRRREEEQRSEEQKLQAERERQEKARQLQLKNQQAMRKALEGSITVYRDPKASPELKKVNMAMAAAFHAELERVGPGGEAPIDEGRVKQDMENFYNSAEFAIAEERGTLEELTALEPEQLRQRIIQREQEVLASHPEGKETDRKRAEKLWQKFNETKRVAKNSEQFNKARDAMKAYSEKKTAPTRADNYLATETVKRYVAKNIRKAKSDTGKARMALSLAFLKQTMTKAAFEAYCSGLNAQRGFTPNPGENGKLVYNTTDDRYIDPKTVGTVDEVYNETRERLGAVARGEAELDTRDLAMMTALSALRKNGGGDQVVEKSALEAEIKKVEKDPRFRDALKNDTSEVLIDKAWKKQLDTLEGYAQPALEAPAAQQNAPQIS